MTRVSASKTASQRLLRGVGAFSGMTLLSRIFGLIRDMLVAQLFGAGAGTDAFWVAFKIPNFLRRLFAEGAFVQAFVPVLAEYQQQPRQQLREFISRTAGTLLIVLCLLTLVACLAAPWVIKLFAPGFTSDGARFLLATQMLRITFPFIICVALTAFIAAILNAHQRFASAAFTPVLLNLSLISCALWLAPKLQQGIVALAWGVFIAGFAQLLFLLVFLARLKLVVWPKWGFGHNGVRKVLLLMLPTLVGSSAAQINLLIDNILASLLPIGSVSWLYYADRLNQFPLGVLGIAISTVVLPHLSQQFVADDQSRFSSSLDWGLRLVLLLGIPAASGLLLLSQPLFTTLFRYGHFQAQDVEMAARALYALAPGLPAFMLAKVLTSSFYAQQDTRTPMRIALLSIVANIILSLILIKPLAHAGLALATSLSAWLNVACLFYKLRGQTIYTPARGWGRFLLRIVLANSALIVVVFYLKHSPSVWLDWGIWTRVWHLGLLVLLGMLVYVVALLLTGLRGIAKD